MIRILFFFQKNPGIMINISNSSFGENAPKLNKPQGH